MAGLVLITGGARSGKSSFALREAFKAEGRKAYVATAEALDEEMRKRIEAHRIERGNDWYTVEEPVEIAQAVRRRKGSYEVIVVDCLTLWLSNLLLAGKNVDEETGALVAALSEAGKTASVYVVTNEVGMGIVPENEMARRFRDLAGMLNQRVAEVADKVYLAVAGIPVRIK